MSIMEGFGLPETKGESVAFLKGVDFDGVGQVLEVVAINSFTPAKGKNGEDFGVKNIYGAGGKLEKENYLVKIGVLKEGDALKYSFKQGGLDKFFTNNSASFFLAVKSANLENGDVVKIIRHKKTNTDVKWEISNQEKAAVDNDNFPEI